MQTRIKIDASKDDDVKITISISGLKANQDANTVSNALTALIDGKRLPLGLAQAIGQELFADDYSASFPR